MRRALWLIVLVGCAQSAAPDPGLEHLAVMKLAPDTVVPGSTLVVQGASFVDSEWGSTGVHVTGTNAAGEAFDVLWPATFVDFNTLDVAVDGALFDGVGGAGVLTDATFTVDVVSTADHAQYESQPLVQSLTLADKLTPSVTTLVDGLHFVNDQIEVDGDGFLLGGGEGTTIARVTGCFTRSSPPGSGSGQCDAIQSIDVPLVPREPFSRQHASFPFAPKIAGIHPGEFVGAIAIVDQQSGGVAEQPATAKDVMVTLVTAQIFNVNPTAASLGQYVFVTGGGFVGGETGADTLLELTGSFTKTGSPPVQIDMQLVPDFVEGKEVRYVLNTDDALGHALDLRADTGSFTGQITPIVSYAGESETGESSAVTLAIAPVKQVVYLNFETSYIEGLRDFGMRAVADKIRDRIVAVCNAAYAGTNMEFRTAPVTDFALYEDVDLVGVDPNDMGLFGYDNSPGKDSGNLRLYDSLGGVNAATQEDGYPGYGGVFVRSLMGFSEHPKALAQMIDGADPLFDQTFDPFRPDVGGTPITAVDLPDDTAVAELGDADADQCPATTGRKGQMACAVFVLGNLIGGTLAHEIGHSLGLAYPYGEDFHDTGDQPNRLMDAGGARPFTERAQLHGDGPGVFCDDEFGYLQMILPSSTPAPTITRPTCF